MQTNSLRAAVERLFLKSVRFYTFNTPISKGKYRLYQTALSWCREPPTRIETQTRDGRRYSADLTELMHQSVYFLGEYEPVVTNVISSVVRKGDVCLDVGANFGWFTILLHRLCTNAAITGEIHAYEPMPDIYNDLKHTWELEGAPKNVFLNNLALGDEARTIELHRFAGLSSGFSSFSTEGKSDFQTFEVPMTTLNSYLTDKNLENVNFVKVDVEGAELMFLRGATQLFEQETPPILMMEMALGTTKGFGYLPNDLLVFIQQHAEYEFYALDETAGTLLKIKEFAHDNIGANVLCFPKNGDRTRIEKLKII